MKVHLDQNCKYLLFVGSGRTGSTLVGQLLNHHPNILVTNESRVLNNVVETNTPISMFVSDLVHVAINEAHEGTRQYDQPGQSDHKSIWQRDWKKIEETISKQTIKYIGDKKQGGNTKVLRSYHDKVMSLIDLDFVPITIIREPLDVLASYIRINGDVKNSIETFANDMIDGHKFARENHGLVIKYDNILKSPSKWADWIQKELDIVKSKKWAHIVDATVSKNKKSLGLASEHIKIFHDSPLYDKVYEIMNDYDF